MNTFLFAIIIIAVGVLIGFVIYTLRFNRPTLSIGTGGWWKNRVGKPVAVIGNAITIFLVLWIKFPNWFMEVAIKSHSFWALIVALTGFYAFFLLKEAKPDALRWINVLIVIFLILSTVFEWNWDIAPPTSKNYTKKIGGEWTKLPGITKKGTGYLFTIMGDSVEIFIARDDSGFKKEKTQYLGETADGLARRFYYETKTDNPTKTPYYACIKSPSKEKIKAKITVAENPNLVFCDLINKYQVGDVSQGGLNIAGYSNYSQQPNNRYFLNLCKTEKKVGKNGTPLVWVAAGHQKTIQIKVTGGSVKLKGCLKPLEDEEVIKVVKGKTAGNKPIVYRVSGNPKVQVIPLG